MFGGPHYSYQHHFPPYAHAHGRGPVPHAHAHAHALAEQDFAVNFSHQVAQAHLPEMLRKRKRMGDAGPSASSYALHASSIAVNEIYAISEVSSKF